MRSSILQDCIQIILCSKVELFKAARKINLPGLSLLTEIKCIEHPMCVLPHGGGRCENIVGIAPGFSLALDFVPMSSSLRFRWKQSKTKDQLF